MFYCPFLPHKLWQIWKSAQTYTFYANLQILQIFSSSNFGTNGVSLLAIKLQGAKEANGSIFTMPRISIWKWLLLFFLLIMPQSSSPLAVRHVFKRVMIISHGFNSKVPGILHMLIILFCSCWLNESRCLNESEFSLSLLNTSSFPRIGSSSPSSNGWH